MVIFWSPRSRVEKLRKEVQDSFENVKEDIGKVGDWIKHIDVKCENNDKKIGVLRDDFEILKEAVEELKSQISFVNPGLGQGLFKQSQAIAKEQTNNLSVQTSVQTAVQTGNLEQLTMMERAIVFILLNNDKKLSYEDISVMLGKKKSTIRGQINTIKQKIPGLVEENRELNGKKRLGIGEKNREILLKNVKVRVGNKKSD